MVASTSETVSVSSHMVISTRGTMTSRATASPRSKISWIMRFSSSRRSSCSETMYLISSSDTLWRSSALLIRRSVARPSAQAPVAHTTGRAIFWKTESGPTTCLETFSALARPMRLGTSSPMTVEMKATASVMMTGARPRATAESGAMPKLMSQPASGSERLVDATAEDAKPTRVMATWMVARNSSESLASLTARAARRSP